ncbi:hypothetical protein KR52_06925 [Synechococcus sp. KORDI-52]|nr:hypothetical protein KR52_06925 [Synechococcus sp. KORDI-52]
MQIERGALILLLTSKRSYDTRTTAIHLVSVITRFHDDAGDVPPIKFEIGHQGIEREHLTRFVWDRIMRLLLMGKDLEANSLLEEFDEPPLWDDPLN